jgi:putative transposase
MQDAKPGSHTIWDCKYHLVWTTKYRFAVLGGDVGQRARELLREIAHAHEMITYAGSINRDYVHMLIGIPPNVSVSRAVQYLKEKSSHKLLSEYQSLRKRYWDSTCGAGAIGLRPAATSRTRCGRNTLKIKSRLSRMITFTLYRASRPLRPTESGFQP